MALPKTFCCMVVVVIEVGTARAAFCDEVKCHNIKYEKTSSDAVLITDGFAINKDLRLASPHVILIENIVGGSIFIPSKDSTSLLGPNNIIGVTWEFLHPNLQYVTPQCIYKSTKEGAEISFTDRGVLVSGFEITDPK